MTSPGALPGGEATDEESCDVRSRCLFSVSMAATRPLFTQLTKISNDNRLYSGSNANFHGVVMINKSLTVEALEDSVRRTFIGGRVQRRMISPQTLLYKFTGNPLVAPTGNISPWWSAVEPIEPGDTGLQGLLEYAARLNVTPNDYARARSAVTKQWNSLSNLLVVRLNVPVYAFVGQCSAQPVDNETPVPRKILYIGGAWQLYIPNLRRDHVVQV